MEKLTRHEVIRHMGLLVRERGVDYVYQPPDDGMCSYLHGDEPGCIVGHVMLRAGMDKEELRRCEGEAVASWAAGSGIMTQGTVLVLQAAQSVQDRDGTWHLAFKTAESVDRACDQLGIV